MTDDFDFEVPRRHRPEAPPPFECVICERTAQPDPWRKPDAREPICKSCERHWCTATRLKPSGFTRGDHRNLMRLSAVTTALDWEIHNGKHAKRGLAFG